MTDEREKLAALQKDLDRVFRKHGVQMSPDHEYGGYYFDDYTDFSDALTDKYDVEKAEREESERYWKERARKESECEVRGRHLWTEWTTPSMSSIGDIQRRHCTHCSTNDVHRV